MPLELLLFVFVFSGFGLVSVWLVFRDLDSKTASELASLNSKAWSGAERKVFFEPISSPQSVCSLSRKKQEQHEMAVSKMAHSVEDSVRPLYSLQRK